VLAVDPLWFNGPLVITGLASDKGKHAIIETVVKSDSATRSVLLTETLLGSGIFTGSIMTTGTSSTDPSVLPDIKVGANVKVSCAEAVTCIPIVATVKVQKGGKNAKRDRAESPWWRLDVELVITVSPDDVGVVYVFVMQLNPWAQRRALVPTSEAWYRRVLRAVRGLLIRDQDWVIGSRRIPLVRRPITFIFALEDAAGRHVTGQFPKDADGRFVSVTVNLAPATPA